jgi:hypothetical protein
MLEPRTRTRETATKDGYKIRREAYSAAAAHSHELQCSLFGKTYEPVPEIRKRLDSHLKAHTINKMKHEIDEINKEESNDGRR